MEAQHRLRETREFRRVFARGRSGATGRIVLYWLDKRHGDYRVGLSVSRKVGNAVVRNLLKRRLRACFQAYGPSLAERSIDLVVVCRPSAAGATYAELSADLAKLLRKARIMV